LANEIKTLKKSGRELKLENASLKQLLASSGLVTTEASGGLIRKGRPPKNGIKQLCRRISKTKDVIRCAGVLMGPDLASNIDDIVRVAAADDPRVRAKLRESGGLPLKLVQVVDRRHKKKVGGVAPMARWTPEKSGGVSVRNTSLWVAKQGVAAKQLKGLGKASGAVIAPEPRAINKHLIEDPSLPTIEFVEKGRWPLIWTPPSDLMEKLTSNTRFTSRVWKEWPYSKLLGKLFFWYLGDSAREHAKSGHSIMHDEICCALLAGLQPGAIAQELKTYSMSEQWRFVVMLGRISESA
jgi:hypothetical protein